MLQWIRSKKTCLAGVLILIGFLFIVGCKIDFGSDPSPVKDDDDDDKPVAGGTVVGNPDKEVLIAGSSQKGPFQEGSQVTVCLLNGDLDQTGNVFITETDATGRYEVPPMRLTITYVESFVEGFYFDEISGFPSASGQLDLSGIYDAADNRVININILTTMAKPRVLYLVDNGTAFEDATIQAGAEVLDIFGLQDPDMTLFEDMTMLEDGDPNAILLAVSAVLMQMAHDTAQNGAVTAALADILVDIKTDLEPDGVLDDAVLIDGIEAARMRLSTGTVRSNMESEYTPPAIIPPFENYIIGSLDIEWTIDCAANNVSLVEADIEDAVLAAHIHEGPWPCAQQGQAGIALNAGTYDQITLNFFNAGGSVVLHAEKANVTILPGQTTTAVFSTDDFKSGILTVKWDLDCGASGVSTVEAVVYDSAGNMVQTGGPWNCEDGQGTMADIAEMTGGRVVLIFKDADGNVLYQAEKTGLDIAAGGVLDLDPVVLVPPVIESPAEGSVYELGDAVTFTGRGYDSLGNPVSGNSLVWTSSLDGPIGTGETFAVSGLSHGAHEITLSVVDSVLTDCTASVVIHVAGTIRVPGDYLTIQAGIDAAGPRDTVLVADGTYTGNGNRNIDFSGKDITVMSENGPENCIVNGQGLMGFRFHLGETENAVLSGFTITNTMIAVGCSNGATPVIDNCVITGCNTVGLNPHYAIKCVNASPRITNCRISGNDIEYGIHCTDASPSIINCLIGGNKLKVGIWSSGVSPCPVISNSTVSNNTGGADGIYIYGAAVIIKNSVVWGNPGKDLHVCLDSVATVSYSVIGSYTLETDNNPNPLPGYIPPEDGELISDQVIADDPLLIDPAGNNYRLSQIAAGQAADSPCVDTGDPATPADVLDVLSGKTTRTDGVADAGVVDMGYHY